MESGKRRSATRRGRAGKGGRKGGSGDGPPEVRNECVACVERGLIVAVLTATPAATEAVGHTDSKLRITV
jgi:hypothetical protein